jgi:acetylornithine/succinyldiaminopimelate/putrescine aminotransferase
MVGFELKTKSKPVLERLMGKGVLALPAGPTVVRLLPPLVISETQLALVCDTLAEVLQA